MRPAVFCLIAGLAAGLAVGARRPAFAGSWMLDSGQSTGDAPAWAAMTVAEDGHWLHMVQNDKEGRLIRSIEGECKTDGRFHPVAGGNGGSISCKWEGSALVTNQHWNNDSDQRSVRTMLSPEGKLIQDIHEAGAGGSSKDAHLVWTRQ